MVCHLESLHNVYVGDIKAGSIEALRVIDKNSFDAGKCKNKIRLLLKKGLITKDEAHDSLEILSSGDEILARSKIKFHIVRWTPAEVLAGHKTLRDGSEMTLEKAFNCPTIAKMDIIGFVQNNRYTDFSVIYEFRNRGKALNPDKIDIEKSLKQNIKGYEKEGNYFKAMKRQFALAKYTGDKKTIERLTPILNSDLGRLYHVLGDIGTLETLLEEHNAPLKKIRYEIDQFKNRLANVYTLKDYLKEEPHILKEIDAILKKPKGKILQPLSQVGRELEAFLQNNAKKFYGAGDVVIPKKDFIAEHEHLIKLLNDVNNPKTRKEAKKQLAELRRLRGAGHRRRLKGAGELEDALARRPDLKAKYDDKERFNFRQDFYDTLVRGIVSKDKYYEKRNPRKPYEEFRNQVIENAISRAFEDKELTMKSAIADAEREQVNKEYENYYKEHPEMRPVACRVDENYNHLTFTQAISNQVPAIECKRRHLERLDKLQYDKIFTPLLNGTLTFGDWIMDLSVAIGVPQAKILAPIWKLARNYVDPEGRIKSQALGNILQEKLTPLIQNLAKEKDGNLAKEKDGNLAKEKDGKGRRRGIEYRLM